jgi:hypothetical protein
LSVKKTGSLPTTVATHCSGVPQRRNAQARKWDE